MALRSPSSRARAALCVSAVGTQTRDRSMARPSIPHPPRSPSSSSSGLRWSRPKEHVATALPACVWLHARGPCWV
eukprot:6416602-Pyramimonas_sp.AAC.1